MVSHAASKRALTLAVLRACTGSTRMGADAVERSCFSLKLMVVTPFRFRGESFISEFLSPTVTAVASGCAHFFTCDYLHEHSELVVHSGLRHYLVWISTPGELPLNSLGVSTSRVVVRIDCSTSGHSLTPAL